MSFRFYVASQIGDGLSPQTPFRSKIANYVIDDGANGFWDWSNVVGLARFCLVNCPTATHTLIAADPDILALSPELADMAAVNAWLDGQVGTLPAGIFNKIEAAGIPLQWLVANSTRRQLWRFISGWHVMAQWMRRDDGTNLVPWLRNNLNTRANQLSANQRNAAQTWMTNRGLDTSGITGTTTVRQVIVGILQSGQIPTLPSGPIDA